MESRVGNIDDYCWRCIRYFAYSKWSQAVKEKIRSAILIHLFYYLEYPEGQSPLGFIFLFNSFRNCFGND
jgi:hypothetical protein